MDSEFEKIKKFKSKNVYERFMLLISKIYEDIKYTEISSSLYKKLVLEVIEDSVKSYRGKFPFRKYLENNIYLAISIYVQEKLKEKDFFDILIKNYVKEHLEEYSNYKDAYKLIKSFEIVFNMFKIDVNPDIILNIINSNPEISNALEILLNKNYKGIVHGRMETIFKNDCVLSFMRAFLIIKDIEINEDDDSTYDYDENGINLSDSYKMFFKDLPEREPFTREEERELLIKTKNGDEKAKSFFVQNNLKLVASIAKRFYSNSLGMEFLDLVQEGSIGLLTAIDKFDINKNVKFSTYATEWIRQAITRAIANKSRIIRIPVHIHEQLLVYKKTYNYLEFALERTPTIEEVAEEMKITTSQAFKLRKYLTNYLVSLNELIYEEDATLQEIIPSEEITPEEIYLDCSIKKEVEKLLINSGLSELEIEVILYRFGFKTGKPMKLEEIGKIVGRTRERIRQIEAKGMIKLRRSPYLKAIVLYMQNPDESLREVERLNSIYYGSNSTYSNIYSKKMFLK